MSKEKKEKPFRYGGQAVLDGVMMRGKSMTATAVRRPSGGIAVDTRPIGKVYTGKWRKIPFIRGIFALVESFVLGAGALYRSASIALEEEVEEIPTPMVWLIFGFSMVLAVALFILAPLLITSIFSLVGIELSSFVFNLIEGIVRLLIFVLYIVLIARMDDIRNTFAYHGAEHATIAAYENGQKLDPKTIDVTKTAHSRCGTSFVVMVLVIAILVFSVVGIHNTWLMILSRLILLPVIAAVGYELLMFTASNSDNKFVRIIMQPGLWFQKLTTRTPNEKQLEVAVSAFRRVLNIDKADGDIAIADVAQEIAEHRKEDSIDIDKSYDEALEEVKKSKRTRRYGSRLRL